MSKYHTRLCYTLRWACTPEQTRRPLPSDELLKRAIQHYESCIGDEYANRRGLFSLSCQQIPISQWQPNRATKAPEEDHNTTQQYYSSGHRRRSSYTVVPGLRSVPTFWRPCLNRSSAPTCLHPVDLRPNHLRAQRRVRVDSERTSWKPCAVSIVHTGAACATFQYSVLPVIEGHRVLKRYTRTKRQVSRRPYQLSTSPDSEVKRHFSPNLG